MPTPDAPNGNTLQQRLRALAEHHSQAEIARRTGVSPVTVSRYVGGRRVTAAFCTQLIEHLGVNPTWLMTGEGTMFLADVTAETGRLGGDLLELVQAMEAVARMRLGALAGRPDRQVLRQLDGALRRHEALAADLNARSRPVFESLLAEFREALLARDYTRAEPLRKAARQVARLCDDPALHRTFASREGYMEARYGNEAAATEYHRRAFAMALSAAPEPTDDLPRLAYNFANLLHRTWRLREARRVCRAALAWLGEERLHDTGPRMLALKRANLDTALGDLRAGLATAPSDLAQLPPIEQARIRGAHEDALILSGSHAFESALAAPTYFSKPVTLLQFARWLQDPERVRAASALLTEHPDAGSDPVLHRRRTLWAECALAALEGAPGRVLARLQDDRPLDAVSPAGVTHAVVTLDVARMTGDARAARRALLQADEAVASLPDDVEPDVWTLAFLHRAALAVSGPRQRERRDVAAAFFEAHVARGYALLASAVCRPGS